jgi:iron complex transport system permease protein
LSKRIVLSLVVAFLVIVLAVAVGSVFVPFRSIARVFLGLFSGNAPDDVIAAIILNSRIPRVVLAFIVGAMLSVSGAVMQSVLRNPLASSFTLGVSSGASLGAALVLLMGVSVLSAFSMPFFGFVFAMGTMVAVIALASRMDSGKVMSNNTIILIGMVMSLFINAVTTLLMTMNRESLQRLFIWQLGSFAMRGWLPVLILLPVLIFGGLMVLRLHREMDIMTFGEETAQTIGVNMKRVKWILLFLAAAMTGSAIAFVGIIGFVDLVAPHVVRRLFGVRHNVLIPLSALFGGTFMVAADTIARVITPPAEMPIGVITALIGAPFFAYIYLKGRKVRNGDVG